MFRDLISFFFPKVCEACSRYLQDGEYLICSLCRHELPVTNFHFENAEAVKKVLYGRVKLTNATSLLHFSKQGLVQQLLHNLKYRGHEHIGTFFGKWLGSELASIEAYKAVDVIIPVPLHKTKLRKRGYNQVAKFGVEIAKALNAEYNESALIKTRATQTQVFKDRVKRFNTYESIFFITNSNVLKGKHILIVDDLITTGATIEACASVLLKIDNITLSLATMAIAD